jgi:hypothetical protein
MVNLENITKKTGKFLRNSALGIALLATPLNAIEKYMEIQVLDARTHMPIPGANVSCGFYEGNYGGTIDGDTTDQEGKAVVQYGMDVLKEPEKGMSDYKSKHKELEVKCHGYEFVNLVFQDDWDLAGAKRGQNIDGLTIEESVMQQYYRNDRIANGGWDYNIQDHNYYFFKAKVYMKPVNNQRNGW